MLLTAGCSSQSGTTLSYNSPEKDNGFQAFMPVKEAGVTDKAYQPSDISEIEKVRSGINTAFIAAQPVYEQFLTHLKTEPALGDYFSSVHSATTETEKQNAFELLSSENQSALIQFISSEASQQIMAGLVQAAKTAMANIDLFQALDTQSLMSNVGLMELISEKDKLAQTVNQIDYLNSTVISAYNDYSQIAKLIKTQ
ncbi:hypothetical protein [Endozoicomonas sp. Mp262]|uniref:hypothetical protein n=1 Tax=Endozoicomonas sp. Mp262 TaxID=2919499 RepID=UPI0021DB5596